MKQTPQQIDQRSRREMWRSYVAGGRRDVSLRNYLIRAELGKLSTLATRMHEQIAGIIDVDDLLQAGSLGLIDAARRYDPDQSEASFFTFAARRANGAMLDLARRRDPVSRTTRHYGRERDDFAHRFIAEKGRSPTADELRDGLGWNEHQMVVRQAPGTQSLDDPIGEEGKLLKGLHEILAACHDGPDAHLVTESFFRDACRGLSFDQQVIVWLYFVRGATMKEIGVALGLSESRVSQLFKDARATLVRNLGRDAA
ncbi:MAG: sigma-70 family RNA polymerase sigma factor [Planctomycetota bacterium]